MHRNLLLGKLSQLGVSPAWLDFLYSYLLPRENYITVENAISDCIILTHMNYQGIVLGPILRNGFFVDVVSAAVTENKMAKVFADDLSVQAHVKDNVSNAILLETLNDARDRTHTWGEWNRVTFDPAKESMHVIHPLHGDGSEFKCLGT